MSDQRDGWPPLAWIALLFLAISFLLPLMGVHLGPMLFWMAFITVLLLLWVPGFAGPGEEESGRHSQSYDGAIDDDITLDAAVRDVMAVNGRKSRDGLLAFEGQLTSPAETALRRLEAPVAARGRQVLLEAIGNGESRVLVLPLSVLPEIQAAPRLWVHGLLLATTFLTTTWAGALHQGINLLEEPGRFTVGLPYAFGLLLILSAHELGHYFAARRHGIDVTLPYFIPVPFALGTFGAFIKMKSLATDRRALFDVAVAGPLAGMVFALPALAIGLTMSRITPIQSPNMMSGGLDLGSSLLLTLVAKLAIGESIAIGHTIVLHPLAFAGWLGLLLTAFNLLPIGQLDGGHLAHAMLGSRSARAVSIVAMAGLFLLATFVWPGLFFFAFLIFFVAGTRGQPPRNDVTPVPLGRRLVGYGTFLLLVLILVPVPHALYQGIGLYCPYL